jgi:two-component system CheB/CheR fusion protein
MAKNTSKKNSDGKPEGKGPAPKKRKKTAAVAKALKAASPVCVAGIGASAGGLEALEGFFTSMPSGSNMAFVIIQHLAPGRKSIMGSLLSKYTDMRVLEIEDGMKIESGCVYMNPPDKDVSVMGGALYLTDPVETHALRLPIDHFFRSLAQDQHERGICIILSGTATDGTLGLKAVKGEGGMTMVQEESQAKYDSMPRSAINTGLVDFILPVEKMPQELVRYISHPYIEKPERMITPKQEYLNTVRKICLLIRARTGHDFSNYKQNTVRRRIERRMAVHQFTNITDYLRYLGDVPAEVETLYRDMLITVTNFFRDPEAFDVLNKSVVLPLVERKDTDSDVRIWVPG